jgi:hypothetical protein
VHTSQPQIKDRHLWRSGSGLMCGAAFSWLLAGSDQEGSDDAAAAFPPRGRARA